MTWVAWRQLRTPALTGLVAFALLGVFLLLTGLRMSSAAEHSGLAQCLDEQPNWSSCGLVSEQFRQRFGSVVAIAPYFQFIPGLIGVVRVLHSSPANSSTGPTRSPSHNRSPGSAGSPSSSRSFSGSRQ